LPFEAANRLDSMWTFLLHGSTGGPFSRHVSNRVTHSSRTDD
jgi:hypothetical protein